MRDCIDGRLVGILVKCWQNTSFELRAPLQNSRHLEAARE